MTWFASKTGKKESCYLSAQTSQLQNRTQNCTQNSALLSMTFGYNQTPYCFQSFVSGIPTLKPGKILTSSPTGFFNSTLTV
jgi:hypothetical protein